MEFGILIEKNERIKLSILNLLDDNEQQQLSMMYLQERLQLTRYKVSQVVSQLHSDIEQLPDTDSTVAVKEGVLVGHHLSYSLFQKLQLTYLKNSVPFQIFQRQFLGGKNLESRQKFTAKHYISQSKYYKIRADIIAFVDRDGFTSTPELHPYSELFTRIQLTNIYYYFFGGLEDPFPELGKLTSNFISRLSMSIHPLMTPSTQIKLRIFFQIQAMRMLQNQPVSLKEVLTIDKHRGNTTIERFYHNHFEAIRGTDLPSEMVYLYTFLENESLIRKHLLHFNHQRATQYAEFKNQLHQILSNTRILDHQYLSDNEVNKMCNEICAVEACPLLFNLHTVSNVTTTDHLAGEFLDLRKLASEIARHLAKAFGLTLSTQALNSMIDAYVPVLLHVISPRYLRSTIKIFFDFSHVLVPIDTLRQMLNFYLGGGVVFSNKFTDDVDIYVSNTFMNSVKNTPQVTIANPYQTTEWDALRDEVQNIHQAKIHQVLERAY